MSSAKWQQICLGLNVKQQVWPWPVAQDLFHENGVNLSEHKHIKISFQRKYPFVHDDVIKWKHFPRYWPFVRGIHRSPVNSLHEGQWRGALMFSLIYAWINAQVNNREAGDLRRYRAHNDVTVMLKIKYGETTGNIETPILWKIVCCRRIIIKYDLTMSKFRFQHVSFSGKSNFTRHSKVCVKRGAQQSKRYPLHNEHYGVSNHQPHECLLNRLFSHRSKKTSKLRVTRLCEGNTPVTGEFPAKGQ